MGVETSKFGVFANKWFSLYYAAAVLSKVGSQVYILAIPWLVLKLTNSVVAMSSMWVVETLPFVVLGPFLGVLIDRGNRRKIMLWADFLRAMIVGLIPLLTVLGLLQIWELFVFAFSLTVCSICFDLVADFGVIPQLVKDEQLTAANSAYMGIQSLATLFGPAIAGAVIALIGPTQAVIVDSISYFLTFLVIFFIPLNFNPEGKSKVEKVAIKTVLSDIRDGFIFIKQSGILQVLSFSSVLKNFAIAALFTVMTFRLGSELKLNSMIVGSVYSIMGAMGVLGTILAPRLLKKLEVGRALTVVTAVGWIGAVILAALPDWRTALFGYAIINITGTMGNIYTLTIRQRVIPNQYMGRINSAYRMILMSAFPVSAAILGGISNFYGARASFVASAVLLFIATLFMTFSSIPRYQELKRNTTHAG